MSRMKLSFVAAVAAFVALANIANATDLTLHAVQYPTNSGVKLGFSATAQAPAAELGAKVNLKEGEALVDLSWSDLKPALLFGGDVSCYVLWAVTPGGFAKNLGEVPSGSPKGSAQYSTGLKSFALMVTAEVYTQQWKPSGLAMFFNNAPEKKKIAATSFAYSDLRPRS